jgi:hypothetical protein
MWMWMWINCTEGGQLLVCGVVYRPHDLILWRCWRWLVGWLVGWLVFVLDLLDGPKQASGHEEAYKAKKHRHMVSGCGKWPSPAQPSTAQPSLVPYDSINGVKYDRYAQQQPCSALPFPFLSTSASTHTSTHLHPPHRPTQPTSTIPSPTPSPTPSPSKTFPGPDQNPFPLP